MQDTGTGRALSSFLQLPGGGWYNNYRGKKAPKGIRPPTKQGVFKGTHQEIQDQIDAWDALVGEFKKLTVRWYTGRLLWQWAELTDFHRPTTSEMKGGWAKYTLTWITAAQNWRRVVYGDLDWVVGDGTFLISDGTAEIGTGAMSYNLTSANQTINVNHGGTINAPNVTLRFAIPDTWQDLQISNETTGQQIDIDRAASDAAPLLEIDAGARSMYVGSAPVAIDVVYRNHNRINVSTVSAHGISDGDTFRVEGTGEYDGDYYPADAAGATNVLASLDPELSGFGEIATGTVRKLTDLYSVATISDINRWLVLAPGNNVLRFRWAPFPASSPVALTVEFVEHYG